MHLATQRLVNSENLNKFQRTFVIDLSLGMETYPDGTRVYLPLDTLQVCSALSRVEEEMNQFKHRSCLLVLLGLEQVWNLKHPEKEAQIFLKKLIRCFNRVIRSHQALGIAVIASQHPNPWLHPFFAHIVQPSDFHFQSRDETQGIL